MVQKTTSKYDTLTMAEKRVARLLGARYRDRDKIRAAVEIQNKIRAKKRKNDWDSTAIIRRWRENR